MNQTMEDNFLHEKNPWIDDDRSLGALKNVLYLAEKTGHLPPTALSRRSPKMASDLDWHVRRENEEILDKARQTSLSLKMISILKSIETTKKEIDQLNLEIQCHLQDKETKDLTHLDILEQRVQELNELSGHMTRITEEKDHLVNSLQQPYVGDYLKIEARYKRHVAELFPQLVPVLSDLSTQLDNVSWTSKLDLDKDKYLECILSEVSATLATLQSSFQSLCEMSSGVRHIHTQRTTLRETLPQDM